MRGGGKLTDCTSDLRDARGPALALYVARWQVVGLRAGKCPLRDHKIVVPFHLETVG
jgi:hypothetical protein